MISSSLNSPFSSFPAIWRSLNTISKNYLEMKKNTQTFIWGNCRQKCSFSPILLFPKETFIQEIQSGTYLSLFLTENNKIFFYKEINNKKNNLIPMEIEVFGETISSLAAGKKVAFAITKEKVFSLRVTYVGLPNKNERYGQKKKLEHRTQQLEKQENKNYDFLTEICSLRKKKIFKISVGLHFVVALSSLGKVFTWGNGKNGKLGHGNEEAISFPTLVESLSKYFVLDISAGDSHVIVIAENWNKIHCSPERVCLSWGLNSSGCLALGDEKNRFHPTEIKFFRGIQIEKIEAASDHSLFLALSSLKSIVYSCGSNAYGQLGIGSYSNKNLPVLILTLLETKIVQIRAGRRFSIALNDLGELYTWGQESFVQTCGASARTTLIPWKQQKKVKFSDISVGYKHVIARGIIVDKR